MVKGRTHKFLLGGTFVAILMTAIFNRGASATDFDMFISSQLIIDFPSLIVIDASPDYAGIQTAKAKLRISTNNAEGYVAVFSVDGSRSGAEDTITTSLRNMSKGAYIPTLANSYTKLNFPTGYWGYSLDGGENYAGIKAYNEQDRLTLQSSQPGASDTTEFTFGVKIDRNQISGVYSNTLLITAVAKVDDLPEPKSIAPKAMVGSNKHLIFVNDDKDYQVGDTYSGGYGTTVLEHVYTIPAVISDYPSAQLGWLNDWSVRGYVEAIDFESSFKTYRPTRTNEWFSYLEHVNTINGIENFDTSASTDMSAMFAGSFKYGGNGCIGEISKLDVSSAVSLREMFYNTGKEWTYDDGDAYSQRRTVLDLSNWDTRNVREMQYMFYEFHMGRFHYDDNGNYVSWYSSDSSYNKIVGLENFNVSNVTNMSYMFNGAFDYVDALDLSGWNVGNVEYMQYMFSDSHISSLDLGGWDVRKVKNMQYMFYRASLGNIVADSWEFDSLQTNGLNYLFYQNQDSESYLSFYADLHGWDLSNVSGRVGTNLFNGRDSSNYRMAWEVDARNWVLNPSAGANYTDFFSGAGQYAYSWKLDVSGWQNTSGLTSLAGMFSYTGGGKCDRDSYYNSQCEFIWELNVTGWDVSNVTSIEGLFRESANAHDAGGVSYDPTVRIIGLGDWNTSSVTNMNRVFYKFGEMPSSAKSLGPSRRVTEVSSGWNLYRLNNWNVGNVATMEEMFYRTIINSDVAGDLQSWRTGSLLNMVGLFYKAVIFPGSGEINLGQWDVSRIAVMENVFSGTTVYGSLNLSGWNTGSVVSMSNMFGASDTNDNVSYRDIGSTVIYGDLIGVGGFNVGSLMNTSNMFDGFWSKSGIDLSSWQLTRLSSMSSMFRRVNMFEDCSIDLDGWNVSGVSNMENLFADGVCYYRKRATISLNGWDTSNVTSMSSMFANISNISAYDTFDDGHEYFVAYCELYSEYQCSLVNTSGKNGATGDWYYDSNENHEVIINGLADLNTSNVTNMSYMFAGFDIFNENLTLSDIEGWNVGKVTNMEGMFYDFGRLSKSVELDLSGWNVSSVTSMYNMFGGLGAFAERIVLNLSGWNTSNVNSMQEMFYSGGCPYYYESYGSAGCTNTYTGYYATYYSVNISGWDVSNVYSHSNFTYRDVTEPNWVH